MKRVRPFCNCTGWCFYIYVAIYVIAVQVSLSVENGGLVGEDNGVVVVTVTLTGDLKTDVTLNIATVAGTGVCVMYILLFVRI